MLRRFAVILIPLLILLVAVTPTAAQVLTKDPNTGGTTEPEVTQVDERLLQPVTYQGGYKRLHDVADELTRLTGVRVSSGRNNSDWQVRDIPLVVCVKDMPLGRLLKMVAAAAHVQLASETVGKEDPKPVYRFIRTREGERELVLSEKIEANRKLVSWAWDVMAAYGKMPDAPLEIRPEYYEERSKSPDGSKYSAKLDDFIVKYHGLNPEAIKASARVIAALRPDVKEKVLAGEQVSIRMRDFPGDALRKLYDYISKNPGGILHTANGASILEPTPDERENAVLHIKLAETHQFSATAGLSFMIDGFHVPWEDGRLEETWNGSPVAQARMLAYAKGLDLPPIPDVDKILRDEDEPPGPGFVRIVAKEGYQHPALQVKIKPEVPQETTSLAYAEAIAALAKASGFNIISEDFITHKSHYRHRRFDAVDFRAELVMGTMLERVSMEHGTRWFLNENERLLVGYARNWLDCHTNLMPQNLLDRLHEKLSGNGIELDDLTPIVQFTRKQISEWIGEGADMPGYSMDMFDVGLGIWRLYDNLSPEQKKMAKSEAGFPLASLDPVWLSEYLRKQSEEARQGIISMSPDGDKREPSPLDNPEAIKRLVMRVEKEPLDDWWIMVDSGKGYLDHRSFHSQPNGVQKHFYKILLSGEYNSEQVELSAWWHSAFFPRYTPQNELELYKKAEEKK